MNVEQRIRALEERLQLVEANDFNLKGRRATNAGRALAASDLVTLGQARDLIASPESTKVLEQRLETVGGGPFGIPVSLGDTNQQGSSSQYADAQHVHASNLTTKGDLLTYSTTTTRLGVGTTGESLYANSAATPGIAWGSGWKGAKVKSLTSGADTDLFSVALPTLTFCGGTLIYLAYAQDASTIGVESGSVCFSATNTAGVYDPQFGTPVTVFSSLAPTVVFSATTGVNTVTFRVNVTGGMLIPTAASFRYFLFTPDAQVVTFL